MVDLRPNTASLARAAYTWELRGHRVQPTELMHRALTAATGPADRFSPATSRRFWLPRQRLGG